MDKNRRGIIKLASVAVSAATLKTWTEPVVNTVMLPAHALTTEIVDPTVLSCSITDTSLQPIPEGSTYSGDVLINFVSSPVAPNATINWVGQCDGADDFPVQQSTLDANGEFLLTVQSSSMCQGGPPAPGTNISHIATLDSNNNSATCSYIFGQ